MTIATTTHRHPATDAAAQHHIEQLEARVAELESHLSVWSKLYAHAAVEISAIKKMIPSEWADPSSPYFDFFRRVHAVAEGNSEDAALSAFRVLFGRRIVEAWRREGHDDAGWVEKWLMRFFA